jgi:hypothetical protein
MQYIAYYEKGCTFVSAKAMKPERKTKQDDTVNTKSR